MRFKVVMADYGEGSQRFAEDYVMLSRRMKESAAEVQQEQQIYVI